MVVGAEDVEEDEFECIPCPRRRAIKLMGFRYYETLIELCVKLMGTAKKMH